MRTYFFRARDGRGREVASQVAASDEQEALRVLRRRGFHEIIEIRADDTGASVTLMRSPTSVSLLRTGQGRTDVPEGDRHHDEAPPRTPLVPPGDPAEAEPMQNWQDVWGRGQGLPGMVAAAPPAIPLADWDTPDEPGLPPPLAPPVVADSQHSPPVPAAATGAPGGAPTVPPRGFSSSTRTPGHIPPLPPRKVEVVSPPVPPVRSSRGLAEVPERPLPEVPRPLRESYETCEMPAPRGLAPELSPPSKPLPELPAGGFALPAFSRLSVFGNIGTMLSVGIPLARALAALAAQEPDLRVRAVLHRVHQRIVGGDMLSAVMAQLPRAFTSFEVGIVRSGESSGNLASCLRRLSAYQERSLMITRQLRAALVYPSVVFVLAMVLLVVLTHYLVSGIMPILQQARVRPNPVTSVLLGLFSLTREPVLLCLVLVGVGVAVRWAWIWASKPSGRRRVDAFLLRLPLIGRTMRQVETARVCDALATLYTAGIPMVTCLEIVSAVCTTTVGTDAVRGAARAIVHGETLSTCLSRSGFFPRATVHMTAVGEETGRLPEMLGRVAHYNEVEVRATLDQVSASLEPLMIASIGVLVAFIILAVFAPLYQVIAVMG